ARTRSPARLPNPVPTKTNPLGVKGAGEAVGALVLPPDQGAHLVALGEKHCGEVAADGADGAGRSGHEDRAVVCGFHHHIAGLKLRSESLAAFGVSSDRSQGLGGPLLGSSRPREFVALRGGRQPLTREARSPAFSR